MVKIQPHSPLSVMMQYASWMKQPKKQEAPIQKQL